MIAFEMAEPSSLQEAIAMLDPRIDPAGGRPVTTNRLPSRPNDGMMLVNESSKSALRLQVLFHQVVGAA